MADEQQARREQALAELNEALERIQAARVAATGWAPMSAITDLDWLVTQIRQTMSRL